jgi:hypothetical protein
MARVVSTLPSISYRVIFLFAQCRFSIVRLVFRVLGAFAFVGLVGAVVFLAVRLGSVSGERRSLEGKVESLDGELRKVQGDLVALDRSMGRVGRQLGEEAVAAPPRAAATAGNETATPPALTAEQQQEQDQAAAARADENERVYYRHLDQKVQAGTPDPALRERLRKNIEGLRASTKGSAGSLTVDRYDCTVALCRIEVHVDPVAAAAGQLSPFYRQLTLGMAEASMRPLDGDRTVIYAVPEGQQLPRQEM